MRNLGCANEGIGCRGRGMGCEACTSLGVWAGRHLSGVGLMSPAEAHWSAYPYNGGFGALPTPSVLTSLLNAVTVLYQPFLALGDDLSAALSQLSQAAAQAQGKNQVSLLAEIQGATRAAQDMQRRYLSYKDQLRNALDTLRQTDLGYQAGQISILEVSLRTAALVATTSWLIPAVRQLLVDAPRFREQSAALLERAKAATTAEPPVSWTQSLVATAKTFPQTAMWVALAVGVIYIVPRLLPTRREA